MKQQLDAGLCQRTQRTPPKEVLHLCTTARSSHLNQDDEVELKGSGLKPLNYASGQDEF